MADYDLLKPLIDRAGVILMQKGAFTLEMPEGFARTLSRKDYYHVRSWLRYVRRVMVQQSQKGEENA